VAIAPTLFRLPMQIRMSWRVGCRRIGGSGLRSWTCMWRYLG